MHLKSFSNQTVVLIIFTITLHNINTFSSRMGFESVQICLLYFGATVPQLVCTYILLRFSSSIPLLRRNIITYTQGLLIKLLSALHLIMVREWNHFYNYFMDCKLENNELLNFENLTI